MDLVTMRETPTNAVAKSHAFMLRTGLIEPESAGVFSYTALAVRSMLKIEQIVREEMNHAGGQEIRLPVLLSADPWKQTGRWDSMDVLFKLEADGTQFLLGPTHEEPITLLAKKRIRSRSQLPQRWYQITPKFRKEKRPRAGVLRVREFIMKDLYSFDADAKGMDRSYDAMVRAYWAIFTRCGLTTLFQTQADSGAIGGDASEEFIVPASSSAGECEIVHCTECGYTANIEKASCTIPPWKEEALNPMEKLHTPNAGTIAEVSAFLGVTPERLVKTLIYEAKYKGAQTEVFAILIRGNLDVNEVKLKNALGSECISVKPAMIPDIEEVTGAAVGFAGPLGIQCPILADGSVVGIQNFVSGANDTDYHFVNMNWGRDVKSPDKVVDVRSVRAGDCCPRCTNALEAYTGIEVGHVFKLGTVYAEKLKATFQLADGSHQPFWMGCYGIGIGRIMAASIELHADERGVVWPVAIAPYHCVVIPANLAKHGDEAGNIYRDLCDTTDVEVVYDDRDFSFGVKIADAELIGYPFIIVVGNKGIEVRTRMTGEVTSLLSLYEAVGMVSQGVETALYFANSNAH